MSSAPRARHANVKPYVRKQYWNRPTMSWWERAYLPEILRGLSITGGVFLTNMFHWMTFRKGALTTYYPEETRADYAAGNRGKHVLTQRPDGRPQCIACNMCATVCPAKVIEIEAAFDPDDPAHPKYPARFEIDYSRCIFCGLCVEACPEDAIRMVKEVPNLPTYDRGSLWLSLPELLNWNPQRDVAKPYPAKGGSDNARGGVGNARGGADNARGGAGNARGGAGNARGGAGNAGGGAGNARGGAGNAKGPA